MTRAWIWRRLTHNFGWKLASLLLSVLLWFAVVGEPELVAIQPVPLLYRNLPRNLMLWSDAPNEVRTELRGPSLKFTRANLSDVLAVVDLAGVSGPGTQTFTLSESDFSLPQGVAFVRSVPSQVSLRFDWILAKEVPVEIQLTGKLAPGYRLVSKVVEPGTLNVSGPATLVTGLQSARTDPVDLSEITRSTVVKKNAYLAEKQVQFTSSPVVTVRLTIQKTEGVP